MRHQTINEDRGARRAAELRQKFRHVSDASFGQSRFSARSAVRARSWNGERSRQAEVQAFLGWSLLGMIVAFIGLVVL